MRLLIPCPCDLSICVFSFLECLALRCLQLFVKYSKYYKGEEKYRIQVSLSVAEAELTFELKVMRW